MARKQSKGAAAGGKRIRVTQVRSFIGYAEHQRRVMRGLGLWRPGRTVELEDTPSIRGMCTKVRHLVRVEELAS